MTTLVKTQLPKEVTITHDDVRPILKRCLKDFRADVPELHTDDEWDTLSEILDGDFTFYPFDWVHSDDWHLFPYTKGKQVESYVRMDAVLYQALWQKIGLPDTNGFDDHEQRFAETAYLYSFDDTECGCGLWTADLGRPFETWEDFQDQNKDNKLIKDNIRDSVKWHYSGDEDDRDAKFCFGVLRDLYPSVIHKVAKLEKTADGRYEIILK